MNRDRGTAVFGVLVALVGVALLLDRTGILTWSARWSLWPLLLVGYGVSRIVQSPADAPRGLFPIALGVWLFAGEAGWISLRDTWPLLLVAIGAAIVWSAFAVGGPRVSDGPSDMPEVPPGADALRLHRRSHRSPIGPLALIILVIVAMRLDGGRYIDRTGSSDDVRAISVLGGTKRVSRADVFNGGEMVSVIGATELDLRTAALPAGKDVVIDVTVVMGGAVLRVPEDWTVDVRAVSVAGAATDRRPAHVRPAAESNPGDVPRIVVRGYVVMGGLVIRS